MLALQMAEGNSKEERHEEGRRWLLPGAVPEEKVYYRQKESIARGRAIWESPESTGP